MTQTAHTPGSWETNVDDFGASNTGGAYVGVYDDFGKTLAHVLCRDIVGSGGENPYAANARLIAAAPDLLEALEAALSYIEGEEIVMGSPCATGNIVRAAIARAKGGAA